MKPTNDPAKPMAYLRVRNWDKFQYRTDKRLPWIRSHDAQLEDYEYTSLSDAQRGHLHDIRLLANRTKNKIPDDPGWVRAAIRASRAPDLQRLCTLGFLEPWVPDSDLPANERISDAPGAHNGRTQRAGDREGDKENPPTPLNRTTRKHVAAAEAWVRNVGWTLIDEAPNELEHELRERRQLDDVIVSRLTEIAHQIRSAA